MTDKHFADGPALPRQAIEIAERLEACDDPIITSHLRLDGDAIGSELGLAHILEAMGKRPRVINEGQVPKVFRFLPRTKEFHETTDGVHATGGPLIVLDCPTRSRCEGVMDWLPQDIETLCIDHHPDIESVGCHEWIETDKSSVGEMLFDLAQARQWLVTPEAATCLYVAIVTDTGRFTFGNTRPSSLRACAGLIEAGADHRGITANLYQGQRPAVLQLQADAVRGMRLHHEGQIAAMRLTREMFERHGVDPLDTQEFADVPRALAGVQVGLLLREMDEPGVVKASLRSKGRINVAHVAQHFGGGGHAEAAGCELKGGLDDVEERVVARIVEQISASP